MKLNNLRSLFVFVPRFILRKSFLPLFCIVSHLESGYKTIDNCCSKFKLIKIVDEQNFFTEIKKKKKTIRFEIIIIWTASNNFQINTWPIGLVPAVQEMKMVFFSVWSDIMLNALKKGKNISITKVSLWFSRAKQSREKNPRFHPNIPEFYNWM